MESDKNRIFINLKALESDIIKLDTMFKNFSKQIKTYNSIYEKVNTIFIPVDRENQSKS